MHRSSSCQVSTPPIVVPASLSLLLLFLSILHDVPVPHPHIHSVHAVAASVSAAVPKVVALLLQLLLLLHLSFSYLHHYQFFASSCTPALYYLPLSLLSLFPPCVAARHSLSLVVVVVVSSPVQVAVCVGAQDRLQCVRSATNRTVRHQTTRRDRHRMFRSAFDIVVDVDDDDVVGCVGGGGDGVVSSEVWVFQMMHMRLVFAVVVYVVVCKSFGYVNVNHTHINLGTTFAQAKAKQQGNGRHYC